MTETTALLNPITGEQVIVTELADDGAYLQGMSTFPPTTSEPAYHEHPHQTERVDVVAGSLLVRIEGRLAYVGPGDHVEIPAGAAHQIASSGAEPAQVVWQYEPALRTEEFLRVTMAEHEPVQRSRSRWRGLVERIAVAAEFSNEYRKATLPWFVQRPLLAVLAWAVAGTLRREWRRARRARNGMTENNRAR